MPKTSFMHEKLFRVIFITISVLLFLIILSPLATPVLLAIVCAALWHPFYLFIKKRFHLYPSVASFLTLCIFALVGIVPLAFVGVQIVQEGVSVYQYASGISSDSLAVYGNSMAIFDRFVSPDSLISRVVSFESLIRKLAEYITSLVSYTLSQAISIFVGLGIFCFSFYYALKDGVVLKEYIIKSLPFPISVSQRISNQLYGTIHSVIKGFLIVSVLQGVLAGVGFWIASVPQPVLWGTVATVAALVPGFGTALIVIPAVLYSLIFQSIWQALFLLTWGVLVVGTADNVIRPLLTSRETGLHPLFIFLSIIGSIQLIGISGFIIGPVIVALLYAFTHDFYRSSS